MPFILAVGLVKYRFSDKGKRVNITHKKIIKPIIKYKYDF